MTEQKDEKITLSGLSTYDVKEQIGRNPQTGKEIQFAAKKVLYFSTGSKLKEIVNFNPNENK